MDFKDHFSQGSPEYAAFRPRYPDALFAALAERAPGRELAWDCATGSGQAALGLAARFRRVVATDASPQQIAEALPREGVEYRVAHAEESGLPDTSVDLLTVAQALHWLDLEAFYREARRVLAPGGVAAAWCYGLVRTDPAVDPLLERFYTETVGPYWPPERALVDAGYAGLPFPFEEFELPGLHIERALTLPELAGYLGTWSATRRYRQARGSDPVEPFVREIAGWWGPAERPRTMRWPLHLRAGYHRAPDTANPTPRPT
jgi:SAM-dependent methyltransferase